jgi:hypothetical protein
MNKDAEQRMKMLVIVLFASSVFWLAVITIICAGIGTQ